MPQRVYPGCDTNLHGTRLDVYVEEEVVCSDIYDKEAEQKQGTKHKEALPKRVRFYHAKIDAGSLMSGQSYQDLKNVVIIIITPYDPFGLDRMVYTIRSRCVEEPDMPYDDGAKTIFLYTRGTKGEYSEELRQLLHYLEHTVTENAVNSSLKDIQQMVDTVKQDAEVSLDYMKIFEKEQMLREEGREEGIEQGRREMQAEMEAQLKAQQAEMEAQLKQLNELKEELKRLKKEGL